MRKALKKLQNVQILFPEVLARLLDNANIKLIKKNMESRKEMQYIFNYSFSESSIIYQLLVIVQASFFIFILPN